MNPPPKPPRRPDRSTDVEAVDSDRLRHISPALLDEVSGIECKHHLFALWVQYIQSIEYDV